MPLPLQFFHRFINLLEGMRRHQGVTDQSVFRADCRRYYRVDKHAILHQHFRQHKRFGVITYSQGNDRCF